MKNIQKILKKQICQTSTQQKPSLNLLSTKEANYKTLIKNITPLQDKLSTHPLYKKINTIPKTRIFMKNHIFAVWDFMSLTKTLQSHFTCLKFPWTPPKDPKLSYFINSIILDEESDNLDCEDLKSVTSHYELYLKAMQEINADSSAINSLLSKIQRGEYWKSALKNCELENQGNFIASEVFEFVRYTLELCEQGQVHKVASSFTFGREDPIPVMFQNILDNFRDHRVECEFLRVYLQRHVDIDGGVHSVLAEQMIKDVCGADGGLWRDVEDVAKESIEQRILLWDGVERMIENI